jgi:signal transduction histidine kinase
VERARATTPYGYLLKPFSERELHVTIQMVLERCRADLALQQNERRLAHLVEQRTIELQDQIAERLKTERALYHAQKMEAVGQLTAGLAHDFNNLLTAIAGCLDLVQKYTDDRRVDRLLDSARLAAARGQKLISQLISFSRQQVLHPNISKINPLIAVFYDLWKQACGESVTFELKLEAGLGTANIDPAQLQSAILNLVVNARDAMPNGGRLTLETVNAEIYQSFDVTGAVVRPGRYVVIGVRDTGVGMTPEVRDRAIEPFFTTKGVGKGSGMGLSQVYGFVHQSGGYLQIEGEPGHGTTVHLLLPRAESRLVAGPRPDTTLGKPAVLVVEDDPVVLDVAVEILAGTGYQVYTAEDSAQAMELLRTDIPIDVLFTDIVMPQGMNGVQLARQGRELRPDISVLLTSGYPRDALEDQQGLARDHELLSKPYYAETLIDAINRAMRRLH